MSAKKTSARKSASKSSTSSARGQLIKVVVPQPRRKGTKAYKLYAEMAAFVKARRGKATVDQVLAETGYRRVDLNWDVERGFVKVA